MDVRLWNGIVKHLTTIDLDPLGLFDKWKFGPGSGWENVAGHCLVQAGAHLVFDPIIGCEERTTLMLARTALCHDLKKRAEKVPGDFTEKEKADAEALLAAAQPNWPMVEEVLVPKFLIRFVLGKIGPASSLLFIVDDMARGDEIVSFNERIDEASARNPDPEPEIRKMLARPYWDVEREVGHIILTRLVIELRERGVELKTMNDIPRLINNKMWETFVG